MNRKKHGIGWQVVVGAFLLSIMVIPAAAQQQTFQRTEAEFLDVFSVTPPPIDDGKGLKEIVSDYEELTTNFTPAKAIVLFDSGSARIQSVSKQVLSECARAMKRLPDAKFVVAGHTDSVGSDQANLTLSLNRANSVMVFLIKEGVKGKQLIPAGYGEFYPLPDADNDTPEGREQNRRVEFMRLK